MKTKHLRLMQRVYIILFFCFMYLPIAYMIVFSFNQSKGYALFTGFTLKWYTSLFHNTSILRALAVSVEVALISAVIATILGTAASLGIASMGRKSRLVVTNIPEGMVIIAPLLVAGVSRLRTFLIALSTGLLEVLGVWIGFGLGSASATFLPVMLVFAGGAMLYVTSDEMIPETHTHGYQKQATYALLLGFVTLILLERAFE